MTILLQAVYGQSGLARSFPAVGSHLRQNGMVALVDNGVTYAAIIPFVTARYLGGQDIGSHDPAVFITDAQKLLRSVWPTRTFLSERNHRRNVTEISRDVHGTLSPVSSGGVMITLVSNRTPEGVIVPKRVIGKLAGEQLSIKNEERIKCGIAQILDTEAFFAEKRFGRSAHRPALSQLKVPA